MNIFWTTTFTSRTELPLVSITEKRILPGVGAGGVSISACDTGNLTPPIGRDFFHQLNRVRTIESCLVFTTNLHFFFPKGG